MVLDIVLLMVSLVLVLVGANYLVDGSSQIAKRVGMSDFIIGLTVVAIGTSAPEMVVSIISSINGNADIAVGNVIGSNIFNILGILGVTALIMPISLNSNNILKDIPFGFLAAFILCVLGYGAWLNHTQISYITRTDGIMLLSFYGIFMAYTMFAAKSNKDKDVSILNDDVTKPKQVALWFSIVLVIGGLAALIFGGDLFVKKASTIAKYMGVSDAIIAVTIMAFGTSLPELASSIVAALKKKTDLALGNVIGSNITNVFLILGAASVINPLNTKGISDINYIALIVSSFLLFATAFTFKKRKIDRTEGGIFILLYVMFIVMLIKGW